MDVVTTAALVSVSDFSGVSLELGVTYVNAAPDGDAVNVDARVLKAGGAVAVLGATLTARRSGRLVAEARHTKYLPRTPVRPQLERMRAARAAATATATGGGGTGRGDAARRSAAGASQDAAADETPTRRPHARL